MVPLVFCSCKTLLLSLVPELREGGVHFSCWLEAPTVSIFSWATDGPRQPLSCVFAVVVMMGIEILSSGESRSIGGVVGIQSSVVVVVAVAVVVAVVVAVTAAVAAVVVAVAAAIAAAVVVAVAVAAACVGGMLDTCSCRACFALVFFTSPRMSRPTFL